MVRKALGVHRDADVVPRVPVLPHAVEPGGEAAVGLDQREPAGVSQAHNVGLRVRAADLLRPVVTVQVSEQALEESGHSTAETERERQKLRTQPCHRHCSRPPPHSWLSAYHER